MDKLMSVLAFVTFAGFLGILAWFVAEVDLTLLIVLVVGLLGVDLATSAWGGKG